MAEGAGSRMRAAREREGLSQEAAVSRLRADGVKTTAATLSKYERERLPIPLEILMAACRVYDASPLRVLIDLGPLRWSELRTAPIVREGPAPYESDGSDADLRLPVRSSERRALTLLARVRQIGMEELLRDLIDMPAVLQEEERIRKIIERYDERLASRS